MLTLALPKGRLAEETVALLIDKGWMSSAPAEDTRELTFVDPLGRIKVLLVKPQDVPTYVEECAADAGVTGWDVLSEGNFDLLIPLDLKIGKCRLSLAGNETFELSEKTKKVKVATKYPRLAREFFFSRGLSCEIIKLYGSIELAPLCGLSDCIVDLVSTGATLKANGLFEKEIILESTARLVFNRASMYRMRKDSLELLQGLS
ncbi:MAG: ATP phosphoribosyltransferase [Spirochaetota bacterium]